MGESEQLESGVVHDSPERSVPDEAALLKFIANLTPDDIDKLVSVAKDQYNKSPETMSKSMTDYFALLDQVFRSTSFNSVGNTPHTRNQRYEIYDEMDESTAYISSALDILSDDATQADEEGVIVHIDSDSAKVNSIVAEFLEEFEIEDKISKWARAIAKYGDLFIRVEGEYGRGVSYINDTIYPGSIERRDLNGKLVAFSTTQISDQSAQQFYAPWDFVHFRHKGDIYKEESNSAKISSVDQFEKNLTSAYGQSILRPAIKVYAQLRFVENMILLSRLTNSIRRNIFLINVGDVTPDKAFDTISNYARLLKKDINLNIEEGIYAASKRSVSYDEDIFIPVGDPQNDVRIESIGGDSDVKEQYDLEYLLNKLFSALKIPKAYLNYEQDLNARSTLVQLDIRYARSVSQLQNTIVAGLKRLINTHLAYLGLNPDEVDLEVTLTPVSAIDEEARTTQQQSQVNVARDTWDLVSGMSDILNSAEGAEPMNLQVVAEHIMSNFLEFDQTLVDSIFNRVAEDEITDRINSSKSVIDLVAMAKRKRKNNVAATDSHAMYPSQENHKHYESIRESLITRDDNL